MQTLTIQKNIIEQSISNMQNAINKKHTQEAVSQILLETIDNRLILKATDHEIYIKDALIPNSIEGTIKCAVNGELAINIMRSLLDSEIIIQQTQDHLLIKQNRSSFKLPIKLHDFPFSQDYQKMEKINLDNNLLIQSFEKIIHCCSEKDSINVAMQGILIEIKNQTISIVATDSKRLGYIRKEYKGAEKPFLCIIPKKAINEIIKLFNENFEFYIKRIDDNQIESVGIIYKDFEFYTKLINAKYPNYENLLKSKPEVPPIKVEKEKLLRAINQIKAICFRSKVTFGNNEITFETLEGLNDSSALVSIDEIKTNITEPKMIGLVNKHFLECITSTKFDTLEIFIDDPNRPIFIVSKDFEEIIMPQIL